MDPWSSQQSGCRLTGLNHPIYHPLGGCFGSLELSAAQRSAFARGRRHGRRLKINIYIYIWDISFVVVCILKRSVLGVTSHPDRDGRGFARPNQQMPKLRHANTMPTHASTMHKTGGFPPVLSILSACVGIVSAFIYRISPISDVN